MTMMQGARRDPPTGRTSGSAMDEDETAFTDKQSALKEIEVGTVHLANTSLHQSQTAFRGNAHTTTAHPVNLADLRSPQPRVMFHSPIPVAPLLCTISSPSPLSASLTA